MLSDTRRPIVARILSLAGIFASLSGAMLVAVQLRAVLPFGESLPAGYQAQSPLLYALFALIVLGIDQLSRVLPANSSVQRILSGAHPATQFLTMVLVSVAGILILFPDIDKLQTGYFLFSGAVICLLVFVLPQRLYVKHPENDLLNDLVKLWQRRELLRLWVTYNVRARYSQTILGILWIILLPLLTALVLATAFSRFLRIELDVPMVTFFLAGLVPYNVFSMGVNQATRAISGKLQLVSQVYFPREILVLVVLGELVVDFIFTFGAMMLVNLTYGISPNVHYVYLPFIILILLGLTFGTMLIVSCLSLLVRDIPQLIGVVLQLLFYLTPVIYPVERLPQNLQFLSAVNPLAAIVQSFRDIVVYNRSPELVTLYFPMVLAGILVYLGYCVFKSVEGRMADMI